MFTFRVVHLSNTFSGLSKSRRGLHQGMRLEERKNISSCRIEVRDTSIKAQS